MSRRLEVTLNKTPINENNFIHPSFASRWRRLIDLALLLPVLLLMLPVAIIAWPLLIWQIGQPIIFKQKRTGKNGQTFTIYKLRTMVHNAEELRSKNIKQLSSLSYAPYPMFKIGEDPRFLKCGKFLSQSGLDELPQLINLLKADMSLVGPRPLPINESHHLKKIDPEWFAWRHQVQPGIFSVWALDNQRHRSLKIWKQLERDTLSLNLFEQYLLIPKVICAQLKKLFSIAH